MNILKFRKYSAIFFAVFITACSAEKTQDEIIQELRDLNTSLKVESESLSQQIIAWSSKEAGRDNIDLAQLQVNLKHAQEMNEKSHDELMSIYSPEFRSEALSNLNNDSESVRGAVFKGLISLTVLFPILFLFVYSKKSSAILAQQRAAKNDALNQQKEAFNAEVSSLEQDIQKVNDAIERYTSMKTKQEQELIIRSDFNEEIDKLETKILAS